MDLTEYQDLKERELVTLEKVGDVYQIAQNQYDKWTGTKIEPLITPVDVDATRSEIADLQDKINKLQFLLTDCSNLN